MELATPNVVQQGNQLNVTHGDDNGLIVSFYMESERQNLESEKAGRDIYKDVPYLHIRFPGDRNRETKRRAKDKDKARFPTQWAAFENQHEEVHEGTPLEEWAPVSRSLALTWKGLNIHTVEHLAAVPDSSLQNLGHGGREMRDKAISWLKSAEGNAELLALKSENERLSSDVEMLKKQIADLGAEPKKKRGRPRKSE